MDMSDAAVVSQSAPDEGETRIRNAAILESLGHRLAKKRQAAIEARVSAGIDRRWYEDVEAYEGRDDVPRTYPGLRATAQGYLYAQDPKMQKRSTLVVNVTRSKVNAVSARLQDIAMPTDDRNWDLRPSTVPDLVARMGQKHLGLIKDGQPIMVTDQGTQRQATVADLANRDMEEAKKCSDAMRGEIDDQLDLSSDGCGIEGVYRAMIDDEALLGVGVIKGPVITSRTKKVWVPVSSGQTTVHVLSRIQEKKPLSQRVNPWDIYPHPECGEHPKKFPIWERIPGVSARDLRGYADVDGYLPDQIRHVLIEGPRKPEDPPDKPMPDSTVTEETVYEGWEYHGDLDKDELAAAGVPISSGGLFTTHSAVVVMVNDTPIKCDIEILDTEDMPYDFFVTNRCSGSWVGYGMSFIARSAQRAITAGWRAMMDNAGQFIGPQIAVNRGYVTPADGKWEIRGMKLWWATDKDADMRKAFAMHEISAHQAEYAAIIKMGLEFLDNETALPQLAQGEQGTATDVLGGMNLLLNASNVLLRRKLKCFDDQITIPHIGRYIDWNMQYNKRQEIKGDFEVQARASGALMDAEVQNKAAGGLLQLAGNPAFAHGMKKWDALRRVVKAWRFDPKDFVKTDDEIKVIEDKMAKQPQQDPRIAVAQMKEQGETDRLQAQQQFEQDQNERDRNNSFAEKMLDEKLASAELTSVERQVLEKLKAELAQTAAKLRTQVALSQADVAHQKDLALAGHIVSIHQRANPQVLAPPSEPAGRASPGSAFQA